MEELTLTLRRIEAAHELLRSEMGALRGTVDEWLVGNYGS